MAKPAEFGRTPWETIRKQRSDRGIRQVTLLLNKEDENFLLFIQERLGVNRAEAIRTSIRVYSALLAQMKS